MKKSIKLTDLGNARLLVKGDGKDLKYVPKYGWLVWQNGRWAIDETGEVERRAKAVIEEMHKHAKSIKNKDARERLEKHALRSESNAKLKAMVNLAQTELEVVVTPDQLDVNPYLFNCLNGTLDLRTGRIREHNRSDLITKVAPVYYDPDAQCPLWMEFLERILNGNRSLIDFVQRIIGYSLTGETQEQCLFVLYGEGQNGKTTFLETVKATFGDYAKQTSTETLMVKPSGSIPNDIARLRGTRCAIAMETESGKPLAEGLIKQLTGSDTVTARFLFKEWFEFKPAFKIFLGCNHKPTISGTDLAIWRRIRLLPFTVTIPEEERDQQLLTKLRTELPGILQWAVEGCLAWQKGGLREPSEVKAATEKYKKEMDALGQFLTDDCTQKPGVQVGASALYEAYRRWCKRNGDEPKNRTVFGRSMTQKGFKRGKDSQSRQVLYLGIALEDDGAFRYGRNQQYGENL